MDSIMAAAEQVESMEDVEAQIGGEAHPAWMLACLFQGAYDIPREEWRAIKTDTWTDEDEEWKLSLNGSGQTWLPTVEPVGDDWPTPCVVEVPSGAHFVRVDGEALAVLHPTHPEFFVDPDVTEPWESAIYHALRDRLDGLGMDIPHVSELVQERDDDGN